MTLKRTGDWGRKKRLTAKTPMPRTNSLRSRGALNRNAERTREAAKPRKPLVSKRQPVTPEERRARELVALRSEGRCEGCQFTRATDWAHRKGAAQGGPWCPSNGLHLCRLCHDWAHHEPDAARALGWMVRREHDHTVIPVRLPAHGLVVLGTDGSITPATEGEQLMSEFKQYKRSAVAEMADWEPGFDMTGVSVSEADREAGSPKAGDMIARNPKNHDDRWLVAAAYFADNFEPVQDAA